MNKKIDNLTLELHRGAVKTFDKLKNLETVVFNLQICAAHLTDRNEAAAVNAIGEYLTANIKALEDTTYFVKEAAKEIAKENKTEVENDGGTIENDEPGIQRETQKRQL